MPLWRSWRTDATRVVRPEIDAETEKEVGEWLVRLMEEANETRATAGAKGDEG